MGLSLALPLMFLDWIDVQFMLVCMLDSLALAENFPLFINFNPSSSDLMSVSIIRG